MLIKAVTVFLLFIMVLGMFGRLRLPKPFRKVQQRLTAARCPSCGAIKAGRGDCPCSEAGGK